MRVIKVNMPLRGGHALKRILPPKKKKKKHIGEKPKLHGVTQDTAVKRTGLSSDNLDFIWPWDKILLHSAPFFY